ncbi:hypothetical protein [Bdellovibrio sp. HCB-110]|uniref:hypothetical protein n=1 Tax=Bdellovibrio sp. HCB-110 TaxID=3391182 RepID=UPI0039B463E5
MTKNNLLLFTVVLLLGAPAWTQEVQELVPIPKSAKKTKRVKISFDDELIKGSTAKPDVSNLDTKKDFNYKKLIRVRENFVNEMESGLDDFKGN